VAPRIRAQREGLRYLLQLGNFALLGRVEIDVDRARAVLDREHVIRRRIGALVHPTDEHDARQLLAVHDIRRIGMILSGVVNLLHRHRIDATIAPLASLTKTTGACVRAE
jgi:hypothetical protein